MRLKTRVLAKSGLIALLIDMCLPPWGAGEDWQSNASIAWLNCGALWRAVESAVPEELPDLVGYLH